MSTGNESSGGASSSGGMSSEQFNRVNEARKMCSSCGAIEEADSMYYGDRGMQCDACYHEEDANKTWDKGVTAQGLAPIGISMVIFCFNPFYVTSVLAFVSVFNAARILVSSGGSNVEDFELSGSQKAVLIAGSVLGGILALIATALHLLGDIAQFAL